MMEPTAKAAECHISTRTLSYGHTLEKITEQQRDKICKYVRADEECFVCRFPCVVSGQLTIPSIGTERSAGPNELRTAIAVRRPQTAIIDRDEAATKTLEN
jgi:hypothetical protein